MLVVVVGGGGVQLQPAGGKVEYLLQCGGSPLLSVLLGQAPSLYSSVLQRRARKVHM